jgi:hypothetical protein
MIELKFISNVNNLIFNEFYDLTDGKIIIGGSSVLKYHQIIERAPGNLNLVLDKNDFHYFEILKKRYNFTFVSEQKFGLTSKIYWFGKNEIQGVFFLQDTVDFDVFKIDGNFIRFATIENIRYNKMKLVETGDSNSIKHHKDVEMIDTFYGNKKKKNIL